MEEEAAALREKRQKIINLVLQNFPEEEYFNRRTEIRDKYEQTPGERFVLFTKVNPELTALVLLRKILMGNVMVKFKIFGTPNDGWNAGDIDPSNAGGDKPDEEKTEVDRREEELREIEAKHVLGSLRFIVCVGIMTIEIRDTLLEQGLLTEEFGSVLNQMASRYQELMEVKAYETKGTTALPTLDSDIDTISRKIRILQKIEDPVTGEIQKTSMLALALDRLKELPQRPNNMALFVRHLTPYKLELAGYNKDITDKFVAKLKDLAISSEMAKYKITENDLRRGVLAVLKGYYDSETDIKRRNNWNAEMAKTIIQNRKPRENV